LFLIVGGMYEGRQPTATFVLPASVLKQEPTTVEAPEGSLKIFHEADGSLAIFFRGRPHRDISSIALGVLILCSSIWWGFREARKEKETELAKEQQKKEQLELIADSPDYREFLSRVQTMKPSDNR
ncbi:MAG: hypothetical protein CFE26_22160, partial [Verrucomicrobiales bacterium VVV1]